jgi:hypothetical protein
LSDVKADVTFVERDCLWICYFGRYDLRQVRITWRMLMPQDTDGAGIIVLLWVAWLYWRIWNKVGEIHSSGSVGMNMGSAGSAPKDGHAAIDGVRKVSAEFETPWTGDAIRDVLLEIERCDRSFSMEAFLAGAGGIYEAIISAFAAGDRTMLKKCLSPEVYEEFIAVIAARESRGERVEMSLVRIDQPGIVGARLGDGRAELSVRFVSELFSVTRNAAGAAVRGDPGRCAEMVDVWTFAKDLASRDPAWTVIASNPLPDVDDTRQAIQAELTS